MASENRFPCDQRCLDPGCDNARVQSSKYCMLHNPFNCRNASCNKCVEFCHAPETCAGNGFHLKGYDDRYLHVFCRECAFIYKFDGPVDIPLCCIPECENPPMKLHDYCIYHFKSMLKQV